MRLRAPFLVSVASLIWMVGAVPDAIAHTFTADSSISIKATPHSPVQDGTDVVVHGKVKSSRSSCEKHRTVKLFMVRAGNDKLLDHDATDREGEYGFTRTIRKTQTLYTKVVRRLHTSYGHSHDCKGATSDKLKIRTD